MKDFLRDYKKRWWALSAMMGSVGGSLVYLVHGWLLFPDVYSRMSLSLFLFETLTLFLVVFTIISLTYLPTFLLIDYLFNKSLKAIYVTGLAISILLPSIYLLRWFQNNSPFLSWNAYLYFLVAGLICSYGWIRSRPSRKLNETPQM